MRGDVAHRQGLAGRLRPARGGRGPSEPLTAQGDREPMRRALALAERGWGSVAPNPMVGAVLVRDGEVVGEGYHARFGGPHAEVEAIRAAGERARGAILYVSLEPCGHHGKTPPCTEAIVQAGIRRVVYAVDDPTEGGGGAARLRRAGLEVVAGVEARRARDLNAAFFTAATERRTFTALKLAFSLDARIAEAPGRRTAITGPRAEREVHRLRAGHDALAVGVGTVLADDPLLTVRHAPGPVRPPVRVVLDARLRTPVESRLASSASEAPVWIFAGEGAPRERARALEGRGARVIQVSASSLGRLDLDAVLDVLWRDGIRSVLFEGGAQVAASLLESGRPDRLYLLYAPILLGRRGLAALDAGGLGRWRLVGRRGLGRDTLLVLARA